MAYVKEFRFPFEEGVSHSEFCVFWALVFVAYFWNGIRLEMVSFFLAQIERKCKLHTHSDLSNPPPLFGIYMYGRSSS